MDQDNPYKARRIRAPEIAETITAARKAHPGLAPVLLSDSLLYGPDADAAGVPLRLYEEGGLAGNDGTIWIACFEDDGAGIKAVREIMDAGHAYLGVHQHYPFAKYWQTNALARRVLDEEFDYQKSQGFSYWEPMDFQNIVQAIEITRNVSGIFLEVGCYMGSSGSLAVRYMKEAEIARDCHFTDTFEGFSYPEAENAADQFWFDTHKVDSQEAVTARLQRNAQASTGLTVSVHKSNIIADPLPIGDRQIALLNLDVDIYEAVRAGLEKCAPRMAPNSLIICEDPGHTPLLLGARLAVDEFIKGPLGDNFIPLNMESGQVFLIRKASGFPQQEEQER